MHIHEAVLAGSPEGIAVLSIGAAGAAVGTYLGLRKLDYERVPQVALLSAAFFVVSLIHVPLGGTSVHLVLNGLIGLVLGWTAFPALLVALLLQAVMCQHGGLLALGLNTLSMALPGVVAYCLFHRAVMWRSVGVARTAQRLEEALEIVGFWGRYVLDKDFNDPRGWEIQNMLTASRLIARSALHRTESRGVHYREDFPETDPAWQRHLQIWRGAERIEIE